MHGFVRLEELDPGIKEKAVAQAKFIGYRGEDLRDLWFKIEGEKIRIRDCGLFVRVLGHKSGVQVHR